jgi:hypothetical protein
MGVLGMIFVLNEILIPNFDRWQSKRRWQHEHGRQP